MTVGLREVGAPRRRCRGQAARPQQSPDSFGDPGGESREGNCAWVGRGDTGRAVGAAIAIRRASTRRIKPRPVTVAGEPP